MFSIKNTIVVVISVGVAFCGCTSHESTQTESPAATSSFGQRQVDQMIEDRPDMRGILTSSHPVYKWLVQGFNGERQGTRIYWNGNAPMSGRPAEHAPAYSHYPPYIAITGGVETTPVDKWTGAVFEMFNLENSEDFEKLVEAATEGSLDATTFASKCVKLEFFALEKTRDFFRDTPMPKSKHGKDAMYNWITMNLGSFEEYQKAFTDPGKFSSHTSNFEYFKEYYETTLLPYRTDSRHSESSKD